MNDIIKGMKQALAAAKAINGMTTDGAANDEEWWSYYDDFQHGFEIAFRATLKENMLPDAVFRMCYAGEE